MLPMRRVPMEVPSIARFLLMGTRRACAYEGSDQSQAKCEARFAKQRGI